MTGPQAKSVRLASDIKGLADRGMTGTEIAKRLGYSIGHICNAASRFGISLRARRNEKRAKRDAEIIAMYSSGHTLARIGELYGISRERIRQRLAANGVYGADGGVAKRTEQRAARILAGKDKKAIARWGCTYAEYRAIPRAAKTRYRYHERNSRNRAIEFSLTLKEWWGIWSDSGKFAECGVGRGKYCMARFRDEGGYTLGNVYITTNDVNAREAIKRTHGSDKKKTTISKGVYLVAPGGSKPFIARVGKKYIGHFTDPVSAILARERFLAARQPSSSPVSRSGDASPA